MKYVAKRLRYKPKFCFCHWCHKKYIYRKCCFKHEDMCLDNPKVMQEIKELNQ